MTEAQKKIARPNCKRLLELYPEVDFIIDDESYFTFANTSLSGNNVYYSNDPKSAPDTVKYRFKAKFEPKLLVWMAISPHGVCRPFFVQKNLAINSETYLQNCIKKRLIPFIKEYYSDNKYVFWPDLATSHYANIVQNYLKSEKYQCCRQKRQSS